MGRQMLCFAMSAGRKLLQLLVDWQKLPRLGIGHLGYRSDGTGPHYDPGRNLEASVPPAATLAFYHLLQGWLES